MSRLLTKSLNSVSFTEWCLFQQRKIIGKQVFPSRDCEEGGKGKKLQDNGIVIRDTINQTKGKTNETGRNLQARHSGQFQSGPFFSPRSHKKACLVLHGREMEFRRKGLSIL